MKKKLRKLIEEDFKKTYECPISIEKVMEKIDFSAHDEISEVYLQEQRRRKKMMAKAYSWFSVILVFCMVIVMLVTMKIVSKNNNLLKPDKWQLSEEQLEFANENSNYVVEVPIFEIVIERKLSLICYQANAKNSQQKMYFYKIVDIDGLGFAIGVEVNGEMLSISGDMMFGILYSFEGKGFDAEELDIMITSKHNTIHYVYTKTTSN